MTAHRDGSAPGPHNDLTDIDGLRVGHATDEHARSGVTLVLCPGFVEAAVDCRGGGPATRETDALALEKLVGGAHAIVLSGGSLLGLGAADAVAARLSADNVGARLRDGAPAMPLVPAACLYDVTAPGDKEWGGAPPYAELGRQALAAARSGAGVGPIELGSIGAGRGAVAGCWKGGVGAASLDLGDGTRVAALVVVNSFGSAVATGGDYLWAWPFEIGGEFGEFKPAVGAPRALESLPADAKTAALDANTTIGLVATNAAIGRPGCQRLAIMAQDGLARAIRPAHTPFDGDTIFALTTAAIERVAPEDAAMRLTLLGAAAADCVARAAARAVFSARAAPDEAPSFGQRRRV